MTLPLDLRNANNANTTIANNINNNNTNRNNTSTNYTTTTYYKPTLVTNIALPIIKTNMNAATFTTFKSTVENELLINDLTIYLEKDVLDICNYVQSIYKTADPVIVAAHVKKQSMSLSGLLNKSLPYYQKVIKETIIEKYGGEQNINNIYFMWKVILDMFQRNTGTHVTNLLNEALAIKHHSNIDPFITVEKFREIQRQLIVAGAELPEWLFYTLLCNSLPVDMSAIKQELVKPGKDNKLEDAYQRLKAYWDSKPTQINNKITPEISERLMVATNISKWQCQQQGVCYYYQRYGNCKFGDSCIYQHLNNDVDDHDDSNNHDLNNYSSDDERDNSNLHDSESNQNDSGDSNDQEFNSNSNRSSSSDNSNLRSSNRSNSNRSSSISSDNSNLRSSNRSSSISNGNSNHRRNRIKSNSSDFHDSNNEDHKHSISRNSNYNNNNNNNNCNSNLSYRNSSNRRKESFYRQSAEDTTDDDEQQS